MRWLLIGGGGCLMLVVLVLLGFAGCLAAFSGSIDGASDNPSKSTPTAKIGEPLRVGDVTWVVEDAKLVTELTSSYERPIRGKQTFSTKRALLARSNAEMNKELALHPEWTAEEISEPGRRLAERALEIWQGPTAL